MKTDRRWLAAIVLGLLALYAASAPRGVALEDDGEFILASWFLGVAHPPGYPVHTVLGFLFSHVPVGTVAWRVHLLSGVLGALAAGVVFLGARRLGARPLPAALAALALGVSETFWSQAIVAEVYTLHLLLLGLAWLLALRLHQGDPRPRTVLALAATTGLALANHWPLMVLAGPALLALAWPSWRRLLGWQALAVGGLATLAPYGWLFLRSQQQPAISFAGPLQSLHDLWDFVSRSGYAAIDHRPLAGAADRLAFARFAGGEWLTGLTVAGALLALLGLAALWQRRQRAAALSLAWLAFAVSALLVLRLDFEYFAQSRAAFRVYLLTGHLGTALLLACGLELLARRTEGRGPVRHAPALVGTLLVAALATGSAAPNWRPGDDWGGAYARAVLAEAPADAVIVTDTDWSANALGYAHFVEGRCPGCTLVHARGLLFPQRAFRPLRTTPAEQRAALAELLARGQRPVAYTEGAPRGAPVEDRWLVRLAAPAGAGPSIRISAGAHAFFRERIARDDPHDATVAAVQQELRRRYLSLLVAGGAVAPAELAGPCAEFHACLGALEGALARAGPQDWAGLAALAARATAAVPPETHRWDRARIRELHGLLLAGAGRRDEAIAELQAAVSLAPDNSAAGQRALAELGIGTELRPLE
jgi:hypothetical protein